MDIRLLEIVGLQIGSLRQREYQYNNRHMDMILLEIKIVDAGVAEVILRQGGEGEGEEGDEEMLV